MGLTDQLVKPNERTWIASDSQNHIFRNRRKHVRIYYGEDWPEKYVPELYIHCRGYQILDISASGIRFAIPSLSLGGELRIAGIIRFPEIQLFSFSGEVVRYQSDQIAIRLDKEIPNSIIMAEMARLRELEKKGLISAFLL